MADYLGAHPNVYEPAGFDNYFVLDKTVTIKK
jgi:hypothetical protein